MKIAVLTLGTRGDVQPFFALSKELKARGHQVTMGAPDNFKSFIEEHEITFEALGVDIQSFMQSEDVKKVLEGNWFALKKIWNEKIIPLFQTILEKTWQIAQDAEVIIYHPKVYGSYDVAEKTGAKLFCGALLPMFPTAEFPIPITSFKFGSFLNQLSFKMFNYSRFSYRKIINDWRENTLGLGKGPMVIPLDGFKNAKIDSLCAFSKHVIKRPKDWGHHIHITGYWNLENSYDNLEQKLLDFINKGESPIYVGFGSMTQQNVKEISMMLQKAVEKVGCRAIIAKGWAELEETFSSEQFFYVDSVPHDLLFPHVKAVIHHGGAGTTAAGLKNGKPNLICPHSVDQPFWGKVVSGLGCGPKPLKMKHFTVDKLSKSIEELICSKEYEINAKKLKEQLIQESGIKNAVDIIEKQTAIN